LPDDPEKQRLRALHVAAILGALDAIATGRHESADPEVYEALPYNVGGANDLMIRGGQLVLPGRPPLRADLALTFSHAVARTGGGFRGLGAVDGSIAIDALDASGLYLHPRPRALEQRGDAAWLKPGAPAAFDLRRGPAPASELVQALGGDAK